MEKNFLMTKGFTLLEVLIAFLILSIGLFSLLAYQNHSLTRTDQADLDSIANIQVQSFFERLRANHNADFRWRELNLWNQENAVLLPHGHGDFTCDPQSAQCTVHLTWQAKTPQALAVNAEVES